MAISAMGDSQAKATKYHYTAGTQHRCNRAQTGNYSAPTALYCLARGCQSPEWQPEILSGGVFGGPAHTLAIAGIARPSEIIGAVRAGSSAIGGFGAPVQPA